VDVGKWGSTVFLLNVFLFYFFWVRFKAVRFTVLLFVKNLNRLSQFEVSRTRVDDPPDTALPLRLAFAMETIPETEESD
jgi:hypothetical protein